MNTHNKTPIGGYIMAIVLLVIVSLNLLLWFTSGARAADVPNIKPNGTSVLNAEGTPCWNKQIKEEMLLSVKGMILKPWVDQYNVSKETTDKKSMDYIAGWVNASTIILIPKVYYKSASNDPIHLCSLQAVVNGQRVVVSGNERRNTIRYAVIRGSSVAIDYDLVPPTPWTFPDPKKDTGAI